GRRPDSRLRGCRCRSRGSPEREDPPGRSRNSPQRACGWPEDRVPVVRRPASLAGGLLRSALGRPFRRAVAPGSRRTPGRCLEDSEDGPPLAVGRTRRGPPPPGRGQDGPEVDLGHIELGLKLLDAIEQSGGTLLGFDPGGLVLLDFPSKVLGGRHGLRRLPAELNDPLEHGATEVGVGGPAVPCWLGPGPAPPPRLAPPRGSRYRFRLAGFQWSGIEQPVLAVLDLQAAPSGKRPDGSRDSKRIGQSCRLTNLGRRLVEYLARLGCLGSYTQECIGSLKALFVQVVSPIGQANTDRRSSNASRVGLATPVPVG